MKILVCGNGPSLLRDLQDRSLSDFDKVVRINDWAKISGYDNRCDAWVFYPMHHFTVSINLNLSGKRYDVLSHAERTKELWLAHPIATNWFYKLFRKDPDYAMTIEMRDNFCGESGLQVPRTGILALHMTMLLSPDVWVTGFDFYQEDKAYYYSNLPPRSFEHLDPHDHPLIEKAWFDQQVSHGWIQKL